MIAQSPGTQGPPPQPHMQVLNPFTGFSQVTMEVRQAKMLNIQRQKAIVDDTDRILQLARELNADAIAENPVMSAAERMEKAEEIEKLAKTVRDKMTFAIGAPPPPDTDAPLQPPR